MNNRQNNKTEKTRKEKQTLYAKENEQDFEIHSNIGGDDIIALIFLDKFSLLSHLSCSSPLSYHLGQAFI